MIFTSEELFPILHEHLPLLSTLSIALSLSGSGSGSVAAVGGGMAVS